MQSCTEAHGEQHPDDGNIDAATEDHSLKEMEKEHINRTLKRHNFNRSRTARCLEISRSTLIRKLKQYNLDQMPLNSTC